MLRKRYYNMIEDMKGKIRVYGRCRPLSRTEKERGDVEKVDFRDMYTVATNGKGSEPKVFQFDRVFTADEPQEAVFEDTSNLIQSAFDGFNVCIFAYGQTGSGKTFTMYGPPELPGVAPRAMDELYRIIAHEQDKVDCKVTCYMLELYRDSLVDLLVERDAHGKKKTAARLVVKKDPKGTVYVEGATVLDAPTRETLQTNLDLGMGQRHVASTKMNAESSRSHLVFSIVLDCTNKKTGKQTTGKLTLVDLAGCERVSKTGGPVGWGCHDGVMMVS